LKSKDAERSFRRAQWRVRLNGAGQMAAGEPAHAGIHPIVISHASHLGDGALMGVV
jgi:hypothetical protein